MIEKLKRFCGVARESNWINSWKFQGDRFWLSTRKNFLNIKSWPENGMWTPERVKQGLRRPFVWDFVDEPYRSYDPRGAFDVFLWFLAAVAYVLEVWHDLANSRINSGSWPEHPAQFLIRNRSSEKAGRLSFIFYCYLKSGPQGSALTHFLQEGEAGNAFQVAVLYRGWPLLSHFCTSKESVHILYFQIFDPSSLSYLGYFREQNKISLSINNYYVPAMWLSSLVVDETV